MELRGPLRKRFQGDPRVANGSIACPRYLLRKAPETGDGLFRSLGRDPGLSLLPNFCPRYCIRMSMAGRIEFPVFGNLAGGHADARAARNGHPFSSPTSVKCILS